MVDDDSDDPELDIAERAIVDRLTADDLAAIDAVLLSHINSRWRKVAMIVAKTLSDSARPRTRDVPYLFYAERIRHLAAIGVIESVGNLRRMRFSEVRKPAQRDPKSSLH